ncbi:MAG TPA: ankyrin repeat domain-containing protein, partial [Rhodospirillales bacterium]|nr:ankyrin repeat domain-containing protein [Rhodospirillales bacterium]
TPVNIAAYYGHTDVIKVLAELGADVNTPDNNGWKPVSIAAYKGHADVIKLLVSEGADTHYLEENQQERFHQYQEEILLSRSLYEEKQRNEKAIRITLNRDLARKLYLKAQVKNDPNKRITLNEDVSGCIGKFLGVEDSNALARLLKTNSEDYKTTTQLLRTARKRILEDDENGTTPICEDWGRNCKNN